MHVAGGQEQDARATLLVADGMELGVAASLRAADTMSQGPPFAPPAQRWTLMQLESMNRRSGTSPAPASAPKMPRSEEHTSELQSLMRTSYAVFCLKNKQNTIHTT